MKNSGFSIYNCQSELEESLMRSVLLYGFQTPKSKKVDQYRKAILSIVIYGKGEYTIEDITSIFNDTFKLRQDTSEIQHQLNLLDRDGLVSQDEKKRYFVIETDKRGVSFFEKLEKDTDAMLNRIVDKVNNKIPLTTTQKEKVKNNAKKALSLYLQVNSLAAFAMLDPKKPDEFTSVVEAAMAGIDSKVGKHLVSVLAYTIEERGEDKVILERWAKAVVSMRLTGLDPMLRNFKQKQIAGKKFVLDTDVVLNALAKNARYSSDYHKMLDHLVKAGATVLIPQFVYDEVVQNAENALRKFAANGSQYLQYPNEELEDAKSNVFIEDYVKTVRGDVRKSGMAFVTYMGNIYSDRSPFTLNQNIIKLLGEKNGRERYSLKENVLNEEKAAELKEIIKERAMRTPKGVGRSIEQLEKMAINDTRLYLTVCDENEEKEANGILGFQCYLVTRSSRTIRSASDVDIYDKHVVCHPQTIISVLDEIGQIDDVEVINLFDNPFLTYTTELIMDQAEPVMKAGAQIAYFDFIQLREKFDLNINEILTAQGAEMKRLVDKYTKAGLLFAKDWDDLLKKTDKQGEELKAEKSKNERLEKENTKLKGKVHYLNKMRETRKNQKNTLKKKRNGSNYKEVLSQIIK